MTGRWPAAARLAATLLAVTGCAAPPAYADRPEHFGGACSFAATSDPTGEVYSDPEVLVGVAYVGPWLAADVLDDTSPGPSHADAARITVHCAVQVNDDRYHFDRHTGPAHCDVHGTGLAAGACPIQFVAFPEDLVYTCTWVRLEHGDGEVLVIVHDDDNDAGNGWQCDDGGEPVTR